MGWEGMKDVRERPGKKGREGKMRGGRKIKGKEGEGKERIKGKRRGE